MYRFLDEILPTSFHRYHWPEKLSDFRLGERLRDKSRLTKAVSCTSSFVKLSMSQEDLFWKGEPNRITEERESKVDKRKMSRVWSEAEVKREGEISRK